MSGDAIAVSVASGTALLILVWLVRVVYRAILADIASQVRRIEGASTRIEKQVTPNGGSTDVLGDRVQRIERDAKETRRILGDILERLGRLDSGR